MNVTAAVYTEDDAIGTIDYSGLSRCLFVLCFGLFAETNSTQARRHSPFERSDRLAGYPRLGIEKQKEKGEEKDKEKGERS